MRLIIQWAEDFSLTADGVPRGSMQRGLFVLVGICKEDTTEIAEKMAQKLLSMRIISDENDRMNLCCLDPRAQSDLAVVSNFTLYANCRSRRPDFLQSGPYDRAKELYETFLGYLQHHAERAVKDSPDCRLPRIITGIFGSHMDACFHAVGPRTIFLDSDEPGLLK